tara:strand:- start:119047 stop:120663 length:1617 start_codon:yes stop_codon:yes gene_type:complete
VIEATGDSPAIKIATDVPAASWRLCTTEVALLMLLFFVYAGDPPPMVNEAHYLVKAKNFWNPQWCANDLFAASGKAHTTFYALFGWPTLVLSLESTAWIGRFVGWLMLAVGLRQLTWRLIPRPWACLGVAVAWMAGIEHGNLAGEWVVGGIEAKVPAYGLVLMALSELTQRHWGRVWILLGAASAFHVLSGGWAVIAAMITWCLTELPRQDRPRFFTPALFTGGSIALFGLLPALWLTSGASSEDSLAAARIYAYFRIKHHLLPANFLWSWYVRHAVLIAMTAGLTFYFYRRSRSDSWNRIYAFTLGAVAIAVVGLGVGTLPSIAPDLGAKLLRYYWFRLTDAIVPLTFALLVMRSLADRDAVTRSVATIGLVCAIGLVAAGAFDRGRLGVPPSVSNRLLGWDGDASPEQQRAVFADWLAVCDWAETATPHDAVFLTPRHQQTFKWYSQRSEVVNWKDVPQDATSLREWYRRFRDVFPRRLGTVRVTIQYRQLREFRKRYGARLMIVDRRVTGKHLPLVKLYPRGNETNETYAVYEIP